MTKTIEPTPETYLHHFLAGNSVFNELNKPGVHLTGKFDGAFFELNMKLSDRHNPRADHFKGLKERAEIALSETCRDINLKLLNALQVGLTETFDDDNIKAELAKHCYNADGERPDDDDNTDFPLRYDQLTAEIKADVFNSYYAYLNELDWWSAYKTPWLVKLSRMGFINPCITFEGGDGVIENCHFTCQIDFKVWAKIGQFEPLETTASDDPGYAIEDDISYEDYANEILEG